LVHLEHRELQGTQATLERMELVVKEGVEVLWWLLPLSMSLVLER
jgi:hypothetical protein